LNKVKQQILREDIIEQASKEYERTVLGLFTTNDHINLIPDERIKLLNFSVLFCPDDLRSIAYSLNELKLTLNRKEEANQALELHVENLKSDLERELGKEVPDIKGISERIAQEKVDSIQKKYEYERD
jgi:hypothetical protein